MDFFFSFFYVKEWGVLNECSYAMNKRILQLNVIPSHVADNVHPTEENGNMGRATTFLSYLAIICLRVLWH